MKLIFLHGMPGVGKLTVARVLAELTGFKLFHNHLVVDLVEAVFSFGSEPFVELREMIWLEIFRRAAETELTGLIFTFAYDSSVRRTFIENVRNVVESNGGEIHFVELKCSAEELEARLTDPYRQKFGKLTSLEQFRKLSKAGSFVDPGIPKDRLILETTAVSPRETAKLIVKRLALPGVS